MCGIIPHPSVLAEQGSGGSLDATMAGDTCRSVINAICSYTSFASAPVPWPAVPSVRHAFAVCHKMWPYRRDFDVANLSKKFKCKNEPCRTIFRG